MLEWLWRYQSNASGLYQPISNREPRRPHQHDHLTVRARVSIEIKKDTHNSKLYKEPLGQASTSSPAPSNPIVLPSSNTNPTSTSKHACNLHSFHHLLPRHNRRLLRQRRRSGELVRLTTAHSTAHDRLLSTGQRYASLMEACSLCHYINHPGTAFPQHRN